MIGRSGLLCYISLLSGLWNVMVDTKIKISITGLVGQLTRLGGTSSCGSESSWCCFQPKRCKSQGGYQNHPFPHRRPASPQTGGRGCGQPLFQADQGWSRCRREGEGTARCLRGSYHHHCRRPPLALMQVFITQIIIIALQTIYLVKSIQCMQVWWTIGNIKSLVNIAKIANKTTNMD